MCNRVFLPLFYSIKLPYLTLTPPPLRHTAIYGNTNGDGLQSSHAASLGVGVVPAASLAAVQVRGIGERSD